MRSPTALPPIWRSLAVLAVVFAVGLLSTTRPTGWQSVLGYESAGAFCTALILVGVRIYRPRPAVPWLFLALGIGFSVAGDFVYDAMPLLSLDYHGFGHLYDICYLASYPAYVIAAFGFLGARARRRDETVLIDGVIYALAGWLVLWMLVVYPQLASGGLTIWDWAPSVLYPPLDVIALIVWWRVGRGDVRQSAPWRFIAGAFLLMFAADLTYAIAAMPDAGALSDALDVGWLMGYALFAAGAVHPLMSHLVAVPTSGAPRSEHGRVIGIGVALATPIALLALVPNDARHLIVMITIVALAIVVTAIARFSITVARHRDAESTFAYGASHDPLTGLANRVELLVQLEAATRRSARRRDSCAVLFVDLDDFKIVNDSLGHSAGDELLCAVATRLRQFARTEECVARLGGDEFVVVLEGLDSPEAAITASSRLADVFNAPFLLRNHELALTASIGVVVDAQRTDGDVESILRDADLAMYEAKGSPSRRTWVFEPDIRNRATDRLELTNALRHATANGELRLLYQPIFETATGTIVATEALLRWHRPDGTIVEPLDFIPVAESSGAIIEIGNWVIRTAAADLATGTDLDRSVTVNVSPIQLRDVGFATTTRAAVEAVGLAPERVILEITESALVEPDPTVDQNLEALRRAGFPMAIDDFGTGYSSLAYLTRLAVDWIKIDRMFVNDLGGERPDQVLVRTILRMADELGLKVIAEGVETPEQLAILQSLGCHAVQGFLLARPAADILAGRRNDLAAIAS